MNAYDVSRSLAVSARTAISRDRRSSFTVAAVDADPTKELHNARGLIVAVLMSAACWAGVGLAFLL